MKDQLNIRIQSEHDSSREANAARQASYMDPDIKLVYCEEDVAIGSVEYCENLLGRSFKPDYYPDWTMPAWKRPLGRQCEALGLNMIFIKPADSYKRFDGQVINSRNISDFEEPIIQSGVVTFIDEWRYYIADGKVLCSWWYKGDDRTAEMNPHGPLLKLKIPSDFCGAVDMGLLSNGEFALVEVQHPYAIGWYGEMDDSLNYIKFLEAGWKYMKSL